MKKFFICALIVLLCVALVACNNHQTSSSSNNDVSSHYEENQDMNNGLKLIINDTDISLGNYIAINHQEKYAKLPLIAIAKSLGCNVDWHNKNEVTITFNDNIYILNPTEKTLIKKGDSFNIIALPPGTKHGAYYQIVENEFIIDSDSIRHFINLLDAKIVIDYDAGIININEKTE